MTVVIEGKRGDTPEKMTHEPGFALSQEQRVALSSGDGYQVYAGPARPRRASHLVYHFTGRLSDASGVIGDEISGLIREVHGTPLGWSGYFTFPVELAGRIRAGENYRLDIVDGASIMILIANIYVVPENSFGAVAFESQGRRLT